MGVVETKLSGTRQILTTEQIEELLAQGAKIYLPEVAVDDEALSHYSSTDKQYLDLAKSGNQIISVNKIRDEEVQCISVDDPEHMYLTDDLIPTHNTFNIVFLKSTDDSMLDTLQKMSGTRHTVYRDSKTVTKDTSSIIKSTNVDERVSYTMSAKEEPVISYNDMAFISERNSIVFRAGDAPVWNRNETILPMSWRMFGGSGENSIIHPGHEYSLQTIPTLSTAKDFDVRMNQPNFEKMVSKRMEQASWVEESKKKYARAYGYSEFDIQKLDPDVYADEIMELVDSAMRETFADEMGVNPDEIDSADEEFYDMPDQDSVTDNLEL